MLTIKKNEFIVLKKKGIFSNIGFNLLLLIK